MIFLVKNAQKQLCLLKTKTKPVQTAAGVLSHSGKYTQPFCCGTPSALNLTRSLLREPLHQYRESPPLRYLHLRRSRDPGAHVRPQLSPRTDNYHSS